MEKELEELLKKILHIQEAVLDLQNAIMENQADTIEKINNNTKMIQELKAELKNLSQK